MASSRGVLRWKSFFFFPINVQFTTHGVIAPRPWNLVAPIGVFRARSGNLKSGTLPGVVTPNMTECYSDQAILSCAPGPGLRAGKPLSLYKATNTIAFSCVRASLRCHTDRKEQHGPFRQRARFEYLYSPTTIFIDSRPMMGTTEAKGKDAQAASSPTERSVDAPAPPAAAEGILPADHWTVCER